MDTTNNGNDTTIGHLPGQRDRRRRQPVNTTRRETDEMGRNVKGNYLRSVLFQSTITWWEEKRPASFTLKEHLLHPTVNCVTQAEHSLAKDVAAYVKFCNEDVL